MSFWNNFGKNLGKAAKEGVKLGKKGLSEAKKLDAKYQISKKGWQATQNAAKATANQVEKVYKTRLMPRYKIDFSDTIWEMLSRVEMFEFHKNNPHPVAGRREWRVKDYIKNRLNDINAAKTNAARMAIITDITTALDTINARYEGKILSDGTRQRGIYNLLSIVMANPGIGGPALEAWMKKSNISSWFIREGKKARRLNGTETMQVLQRFHSILKEIKVMHDDVVWRQSRGEA